MPAERPTSATRTDPRHVVVLKWAGMIMGVSGTIASGLNLFPLAPILLIINCGLWCAVGVAWREPTVWITNVVACSVTIVVLTIRLVGGP